MVDHISKKILHRYSHQKWIPKILVLIFQILQIILKLTTLIRKEPKNKNIHTKNKMKVTIKKLLPPIQTIIFVTCLPKKSMQKVNQKIKFPKT